MRNKLKKKKKIHVNKYLFKRYYKNIIISKKDLYS